MLLLDFVLHTQFVLLGHTYYVAMVMAGSIVYSSNSVNHMKSMHMCIHLLTAGVYLHDI